MNRKICPQCGKRNSITRETCRYCGAELKENPPRQSNGEDSLFTEILHLVSNFFPSTGEYSFFSKREIIGRPHRFKKISGGMFVSGVFCFVLALSGVLFGKTIGWKEIRYIG